MLPRKPVAAACAAALLGACSGGGEPDAASTPSAPPTAVVCHLATEAGVGEALGASAPTTGIAVRALATSDASEACDLIVVDGATVSRTDVPVVSLSGQASTTTVVVDLEAAVAAAGFVAAGSSRTATVGVWSTAAVPESLVQAWADGVAAWNQAQGEDVEVRVGPMLPDDTGDTTDADVAAAPDVAVAARAVVEELLLDGADAIAPLAGPTAAVTADAIRDAGAGRLAWLGITQTGADRPAPEGAPVLVSIERDLAALVDRVVRAYLAGDVTPGGVVTTAGLGTGVEVVLGDDVPDPVRAALQEYVDGLADGEAA